VEKHLWLIDFVDDESAYQWWLVIAKDEEEARKEFKRTYSSEYGLDTKDLENLATIDDTHEIGSVGGYKIIVKKLKK